ncbi:hypothetical protein [Pseudomonas sp. Marseille-QA0332]
MNRQQIATAERLFGERDRLQSLFDKASAKGGITLQVCGTYQEDDVVAAARGPVLDLLRKKINSINSDLQQLGWDGK